MEHYSTRRSIHMIQCYVFICLYVTAALGQQEVTLNSTLIHGNLSFPGQTVKFTCITRNATILEWRSIEYIGRGGDDIQIYSVGPRDNVTSFSNPNTYATRVSVTTENGITVIVSQLFITTSDQFPTASVTCRINGQGRRETISFNTTDTALQEVSLNSTLIRGKLALPGDVVMFTCVTRNGSILEWRSDEYIGRGGDDIQIYSVGPRDNVTSFSNPSSYATRVSVSVENGITVIVSQLFIRASDQFPTSSVTCRINGQGPRETIVFNTTATALQEVRLSSTLIGGNRAYSQQRVVFMCETRNSTALEWQSDEYIGSDIQISSSGDEENVANLTNAYATRDSVTEENGVTVIVSRLFITASYQFPTSSITCRTDGQGPRKTISFNITDEDPPTPKFNSTLDRGVFACPREIHRFECTVSHSHSIAWTSETYIGLNEDRLHITSESSVGIPLKASGNAVTCATLKNIVQENGRLQLISFLNITVSDSILEQNHTITCLNVDLGTQQSITFQMADTCEKITTSNNEITEVEGGRQQSTDYAFIIGIICGIGAFAIIFTIILVIVLICIRKANCKAVTPSKGEFEISTKKDVSSVPETKTSTAEQPSTPTSHEQIEMECEAERGIPQERGQMKDSNQTEDKETTVPGSDNKKAEMPSTEALSAVCIKDTANKQVQQVDVKMDNPTVVKGPQLHTEAQSADMEAPSAVQDTVNKQAQQVEVEMENQMVENSPQLPTEGPSAAAVDTMNKQVQQTEQENSGQNTTTSPEPNKETVTTGALSQGTLNESDFAGVDSGGQSSSSTPERASVPPTFNRQSSTQTEAET